MYDYKPPRKNAAAKILCTSLFAAAAAAFVGSAFVPAYPFILQVIGLFLLVPFIQILGRYVVLRYLYRIRPYEDGSADLEVYTYRGGDRMQLVCRVALSEITAAAPLTKENKKPPHGLRRYNYCPDIGPVGALVLSVTNGDGDCEILFSPDETMANMLQNACPRQTAAQDQKQGDDE